MKTAVTDATEGTIRCKSLWNRVKEVAMTRYPSLAVAFLCGIAALSGVDARCCPPAGPADPKAQVWTLERFPMEEVEEKLREITSKEEFSRRYGEEALRRIQNKVDFTRQKVVQIVWSGSSSSSLKFTEKQDKGRFHVMITINTSTPALSDMKKHVRLVVMPKNATWDLDGIDYKVLGE